MKLFIIFLLAALAAGAQQAYIKPKTQGPISAKIIGVSNAYLYTNKGTFTAAELDSVAVADLPERNQALVRLFVASGVKHSFSPNAVPTIDPVANLTPIEAAIDNYRAASSTGLAFQLIGAVLLGGSMALQASYDSRYERDIDAWLKRPTGTAPEPKYVGIGLPLAGVGFMAVGIGISLNANGKLRLKN